MNPVEICEVASLLKPVSPEVLNGTGKLCLSVNYLHKLNNALEDSPLNNENLLSTSTSSFNILPTNQTKNILNRDVQFLCDLVEKTESLKIIPDVTNDYPEVDLSKFRNVRILEIQKICIYTVLGLQKLRPTLHQITCSHGLEHLSDIIEKCGGDNSQSFTWNELKNASFSHNKIVELDNSFDFTLSLHTLDLSYNQIKNVDCLSRLTNLKHLNLSYNLIVYVPHFKGQICGRLQIVILKNNFIEDISGLKQLTNLVQLDLSQNCLLDHKSFMSISHLASLQWLNTQGNPLSFHPQHRNLTSNYLNSNTKSLKFVLDNQALNKSEKSLAGTFYPILQTSMTSSMNSLNEGSSSVISDRPKRVRNVTITEDNPLAASTETSLEETLVENEKMSASITSPSHLEIKKQMEQLRKEFGESWLNQQSGLLIQDVLGIDKDRFSPKLNSDEFFSSTPVAEASEPEVTTFTTALDSTLLLDQTFETANDDADNEESDSAASSDGEDLGGEEGMFLSINPEVFVVITQTHISERDCSTSKEEARWNLNSIIQCEQVNDTKIRLVFDTVRRDRKERIYEFTSEETLSFANCINSCIAKQPTSVKSYQCMKCNELFAQSKFVTQVPTNCPKCSSNIIVEHA